MGRHSREANSKNTYINTEFEDIDLGTVKKRTLKFDIILFLCVLILSGVGALIIYSATKYNLPSGDPMFYLKKQLIFLAVSFGVFIGLLTFNYRKAKKYMDFNFYIKYCKPCKCTFVWV